MTKHTNRYLCVIVHLTVKGLKVKMQEFGDLDELS